MSAITFNQALAIADNTLRLYFSLPVYYSGILDAQDASEIGFYSVSEVAGGVGIDGNPIRPVTGVFAQLPTDGSPVDGSIIDLVLDRPMTPWPVQYTVSVSGLKGASGGNTFAPQSYTLYAVYRQLSQPTLEQAVPSRDYANPNTTQSMQDSLVANNGAFNLGVYVVDSTGDYAFDSGNTSLKKRVVRRLVTRKGRFAHLPNYGVGVPSYGKLLNRASTRTQIASDAETQIALEPDVSSVTVSIVNDPTVPSLVRFNMVIIPKVGNPQRLSVPFAI